jgi:hypothetical protein
LTMNAARILDGKRIFDPFTICKGAAKPTQFPTLFLQHFTPIPTDHRDGFLLG